MCGHAETLTSAIVEFNFCSHKRFTADVFDREELREHSDARLRVFYVEELNVPLVLFNDVLDHVLGAQGHLLLIGVSSSGKMNGTNVFQTKIHSKYTADDFDGDLRTILRQAGTGDVADTKPEA
ncbi:hypothetical protein BY996DRAFT_6410767 [Phakopsora pachyrhizi]|nr:hypothetical protein BY996DRAFT_8688836 [Phakopsora pachyrhizi]KAI8452169.1 hypothetical protein BY996DRAFT_6415743 [Phakopsora pachyrhizi]KAI8458641.1 hypothetical protein BY996DRAFT_6410767 [Phakopsora pachyrhizi]